MAKPFNSRVQNLVYQLEVGIGAKVLKIFLYILFMALIALLYMATQYVGFRSPRAMNQAQLARTFAERGRLETKVIHPAVTRELIQRGKLANPSVQPDVLTPPVYPLIIGSVFKVVGSDFAPPTRERYAPERWIIIPLNIAFSFGSALFLYMIGVKMFSPRVALTAVTLFFLSSGVWAAAISGTDLSFALLCATFAMWTLLPALDAGDDTDAPFWKRMLPVAAGAVALCLLALTRYAAVVVVPGYILILLCRLKKRGIVPSLLVLIVLGLGFAPWVARNIKVSGSAFGLAPQMALNEKTYDTYIRSFTSQDAENTSLVRSTAVEGLQALEQAVSFESVSLGTGIVLALFVATFFYSFQRPNVRGIRWGILVSYGLLIPAAALFGEERLETAYVFLPFVLLYGSAFFFILLDRMQINVQIVSLSIVALFILLQAVPLITVLLPPRPSSYPPYFARDVRLVTDPFEPNELVCTDMPWATAWYGNQLSLHLPTTVDDFFMYHDTVQPIRGLYITPVTLDKPYLTAIRRGPYVSWRQILDLQLPGGFPLRAGFPIRGGESILLMDRNRMQ